MPSGTSWAGSRGETFKDFRPHGTSRSVPFRQQSVFEHISFLHNRHIVFAAALRRSR